MTNNVMIWCDAAA